jgi:hypothetical protein
VETSAREKMMEYPSQKMGGHCRKHSCKIKFFEEKKFPHERKKGENKKFSSKQKNYNA